MSRSGLVLVCVALGGCTELSPIDLGVCGNGVLESGEDCDVNITSTLGEDLRCGEPATSAECRYFCETAKSCPLGWDCGSDGTCRRASSDLVSGPSSPGWSPRSFEPVDFNGDGRIDLVGGFDERIEFRTGDASGSFFDGFATPTFPVTGEIAVGSLDSDSQGDILLPTRQGFLVWRGQPVGPPLQAAYAAIALSVDGAWAIPVHYPPDGVVVALYPADADVSALIVTPDARRQGHAVVGKGASFDQIDGAVAVADVDSDGDDDIAFAFRGSTGVSVHGIQRDLINSDFFLGGLGSPLPIVVDVSQPRCDGCAAPMTGMHVDRGVQIADVDGDGHPDLLVSVTGGALGTDAVAVVPADGRGGFGEAYLDSRFAAAEGFSGKLGAWPIAAGDLNADGVADYVSANGVFLADTAAPHELHRTHPRDGLEPWTAATLCDVDGDQKLDIVAIAEGEPFVDVLRCAYGDSSCTTTGRFVACRYSTELGVTKVRAGRLQALAATDLALIESGSDDWLSVMYAEPLECPEPPARQARFRRIEQMEIGLTGSPTVDAFEDVLLSTRNAANLLSNGRLASNGARQLSSPFLLATDANGSRPSYSAAERALLGRFSATEHAYADLILLGRSAENLPRLWWVPGAEDAAFDPTLNSQSLDSAFGGEFDLDCARFATGDIDGDGHDEVVAVFGRAICTTSASTKLAVGRVNERKKIEFDVRELAIDDGADGTQIALTDLDGDNSADLVLARSGSVAVFRGGPVGLAPDPSLFELPSGEVIGLTPIARSKDGSGARRIAVLTDASVIAVSADGIIGSVPSENARSLRSADVDGDGLGDLLLLGTGGIDVLLAVPASPRGGRR